MNIAETLANQHSSKRIDFSQLHEHARALKVDEEFYFGGIETTYTFEDGSRLRLNRYQEVDILRSDMWPYEDDY